MNDWRALTVELVSRIELGKSTEQSVDKDIRRAVRKVMERIGVFAPKQSHAELEHGLHNIFVSGMKFSKLLRRQRACWRVTGARETVRGCLGQPGYATQTVAFDSAVMEDNDPVDEDEAEDGHGKERPSISKEVEVFITPGLFKSGDADGENYDTETCITPILVQCKKRQQQQEQVATADAQASSPRVGFIIPTVTGILSSVGLIEASGTKEMDTAGNNIKDSFRLRA